VLETEPQLTSEGYGIGSRLFRDGKRETAEQYKERFAKRRESLLKEVGSDDFLLALTFVNLLRPAKNFTKSSGSYSLKHLAENYACGFPDGAQLGPGYVSNGVLIAAAVFAGFRYKVHVDEYGFASPNVIFNMSPSSLSDAECLVEPNGTETQWRKMGTSRYRRSMSGKQPSSQTKEFPMNLAGQTKFQLVLDDQPVPAIAHSLDEAQTAAQPHIVDGTRVRIDVFPSHPLAPMWAFRYDYEVSDWVRTSLP
jgi:hypothetical protein